MKQGFVLDKLNCLECGGEFDVGGRKTKYCSVQCRKRFHQKLWKKNNPDKVKFQNYKDNSYPSKRILIRAKSRAKKSGIPFNLSEDDIIIPEFCPVLGIKLEPMPGRDKPGYHPTAASLDRIRPELGYVKGNVRVISARANLLKSDASLEELKLVLKDLEAILNE